MLTKCPIILSSYSRVFVTLILHSHPSIQLVSTTCMLFTTGFQMKALG